MFRKFILVICILLVSGVNLFPQAVGSIESKIRAKKPKSRIIHRQAHNDSTHRQAHNDSKSGYNTDVHIVGRRRVFVQYRFAPKDFSQWLDLFVTSKTLEEISGFAKQGKIGPHGVVQSVVPLRIGDRTFHYGQPILYDEALKLQKMNHNTQFLFDRLVANKVLTREGYLLNTENLVDLEIERVDFTDIRGKLKKVVWSLKNRPLHADLVEELRRFIMIKSQVIVVTQEETTRYQSRKNSILGSVVDQIVGNVVGAIFFQDKITEVKKKVNWKPNINISQHFPYVVSGFNVFPYGLGIHGPISLYGKRQNLFLGYSYFNANNVDVRDYELFYRTAINTSAFSVPFWEIGLKQTALKDGTAKELRVSKLWLGGGIAQAGSIFDVRLGLSYLDGAIRRNLGYLFGISGTFYVMNPLSFSLAWDHAAGITFDETGWTYGDVKASLDLHLDRAVISGGYKWGLGNESELYNGWFAAVGLNF